MSERNPASQVDGLLSVVVPHYNDLENLRQCLELLRRQRTPTEFEIVVADNNSDCDRSALEAICRGVACLINAPIPGAAQARNAGVRKARGAVLAFIDSDCRPSPNWLAAGLAALGTAPLVGGRVDVTVDDAARLTPAEAFECIFAFNNERYVREERFSVTANMFVTRAVFDAVGGFRNDVSEDVEWGQRAAALGYRWIYAPDASVMHPARRDWQELLRKWRRTSREGFHLACERRGGRFWWLARNWLVLFDTPGATLRALRSRRVKATADRWKALAVLCRLRLWRLIEAHRLTFS